MLLQAVITSVVLLICLITTMVAAQTTLIEGTREVHVPSAKEKKGQLKKHTSVIAVKKNLSLPFSQFEYFDRTPASSELIELVQWIKNTNDNQHFPYLIIDKRNAQMLIFQGNGEYAGTTPVLLGMAHGDSISKAQSQKHLMEVLPAERNTPSGRFTLEFGHDLQGQDILWIDYEAAISLHRLYLGNAKEYRKERLHTTTHSDNRISYGCINVSKAFYENEILHLFKDTAGFVYIMPEETALELPFK